MSLNDLPEEEESWTDENEDVTKHVENRSKAKNDEDESQTDRTQTFNRAQTYNALNTFFAYASIFSGTIF